MPSPLAMIYHGNGVFTARSTRTADEQFGPGEVLLMAPVDERSEVSHRHEFAWLRDAWATLPDTMARRYPTAEHLRKEALIATGWSTVQDYACGTRAEALRWLSYLQKVVDPYTLVVAENTVVRVFQARSQARGKMDKKDFQASKDAVLTYVAKLLDVTPAQLETAVAA